MEVLIPYNNNIVLGKDSSGNEVVAIGRGIGFCKKRGDLIDSKSITKTFYSINTQDQERLVDLLKDIPLEYISITDKIILNTQNILGKSLNSSVIIALADHIHFAVQRVKEGKYINSPLEDEIKHIYPLEYRAGREALILIKENLGVLLPSSEIVYMAIHFVNAQLSKGDIDETLELSNILSDVVKLIKGYLEEEIDEGSMNYSRFLVHLRYFIIRQLRNERQDDTDIGELYRIAKERYQKAYSCVMEVNGFLKRKYNMYYGENEQFYLLLHIQRLLSK